MCKFKSKDIKNERSSADSLFRKGNVQLYPFHFEIVHTKQDWSYFGSRSGAIPKYLIQHRGGPFLAPVGATPVLLCVYPEVQPEVIPEVQPERISEKQPEVVPEVGTGGGTGRYNWTAHCRQSCKQELSDKTRTDGLTN